MTWDGVGVGTTYLTEGVYNFLLYMSYISLVKSFSVSVHMCVFTYLLLLYLFGGVQLQCRCWCFTDKWGGGISH